MGLQNAQKAEIQYAQACEQWMSEVFTDHNKEVRIIINRAPQKGRLIMRIQACDVADDRVAAVVYNARETYPSSKTGSFFALLLSHLVVMHEELGKDPLLRK